MPAAVEEQKSKVSSDPLDAELLTMTDMMSEDEQKTEASSINSELCYITLCEKFIIAFNKCCNSYRMFQSISLCLDNGNGGRLQQKCILY